MNTYTLGIDIGSTTVKIAILDENENLLFADYERHFANIQGTDTCESSGDSVCAGSYCRVYISSEDGSADRCCY